MENSQYKARLLHYERYRRIIPDFDRFFEFLTKPLLYSIRVNTLKIDPERLIKRLEGRGLKLEPVSWHEWFYVAKDQDSAKRVGKTLEHVLGYYYVQELVSALPPLVLNPEPGEVILDLAAAPGSKTTQMAQMMENKGTIIANDVDLSRISALKSNIDRLGITNVAITQIDARRFYSNRKFHKILLDAPCSSEGTIRKNPWSPPKISLNEIKRLSKLQKAMIRNAYHLLEKGGVLVYSVCTFSPEECEEVVDFAIKLGFEPEKVEVPLKTVPGIRKWVDEKGKEYEYDMGVTKAVRLYPHVNDTGGMFIAKLRKI